MFIAQRGGIAFVRCASPRTRAEAGCNSSRTGSGRASHDGNFYPQKVPIGQRICSLGLPNYRIPRTSNSSFPWRCDQDRHTSSRRRSTAVAKMRARSDGASASRRRSGCISREFQRFYARPMRKSPARPRRSPEERPRADCSECWAQTPREKHVTITLRDVRSRGRHSRLRRATNRHCACINGYSIDVGATNVSLIVRGDAQRRRLTALPALSFVPEARAPPNGCWPTTAPVGLSLK